MEPIAYFGTKKSQINEIHVGQFKEISKTGTGYL